MHAALCGWRGAVACGDERLERGTIRNLEPKGEAVRKLAAVVGLVLAVSVAQDASAQTYNFNVLYNGGGNSTLGAGSDDPTGTNVLPGESFLWTIQAMGGAYWNVTTGGDFFPLMAFGVSEAGVRRGDYTLTLFRNAASVYTLSETATINNYVHIGSNTVTLPTG